MPSIGYTKPVPLVPVNPCPDPVITPDTKPEVEFYSTGKLINLPDGTCCEIIGREECATDGTITETFFYIDADGVRQEVDMSNAVPAVPTNSTTKVKGQFMARLIADGADIVGTIDSELVAAALAAPTTATVDGKTYTFTADDVCAWSVKGLPCEATYLATPGDPTTATNPTVDGTFVNDLLVRADQDEEKGGVDVTTSLLIQDGAVADVCVFFEKELSKTELAAL